MYEKKPKTVTTKTLTTIRFLDTGDGEYVYMGEPYRSSLNQLVAGTEYELESAHDLSTFTKAEQFELLLSFQDTFCTQDCELVRLIITTEVEDLMEEDDEMRELRQKRALDKLTVRDIEVLNLMKIHTYLKTKYHNA